MNYLWLLPGTAIAALALLGLLALADKLLGLINFSNAYGLAGSVLIILWILYLMSMLIISGAVVNASVGGHYDVKLRKFLASNPDRRIIGRPTFGIPGMDERQESTKHLRATKDEREESSEHPRAASDEQVESSKQPRVTSE